MSFPEIPKNDSSKKFPKGSPPIFSPANLITIYTVLRILKSMRIQLGLEAMLEYIEKYLFLIEKDNPRLKAAVTQAVTLMSVEKMYKDAVQTDEDKF